MILFHFERNNVSCVKYPDAQIHRDLNGKTKQGSILFRNYEPSIIFGKEKPSELRT